MQARPAVPREPSRGEAVGDGVVELVLVVMAQIARQEDRIEERSPIFARNGPGGALLIGGRKALTFSKLSSTFSMSPTSVWVAGRPRSLASLAVVR
jgi:hypothetical protein